MSYAKNFPLVRAYGNNGNDAAYFYVAPQLSTMGSTEGTMDVQSTRSDRDEMVLDFAEIFQDKRLLQT